MSGILWFVILLNNLGQDNTGRFVKEAEKYLGVEYEWGGRSREKIDCLGLIFLPYSKVTGKDWKNCPFIPMS